MKCLMFCRAIRGNRMYSVYVNSSYCATMLTSSKSHLPVKSFQQKRFNSDLAFGDSFYQTMSASRPVAVIQDMLVKTHDVTGLPWWVTIVIATFTLRSTVTFPLAIYQNYIMAKVENINLLEMPLIAESKKVEIIKQAKAENLTPKQASLKFRLAMKDEWTKLIIRDNCHPAKASLPLWFQIPTWICFSTALRNLAYMMPHQDTAAYIAYLQMSVGGFLWVPNLTVPDPTYILPVLLGISNLIIIEIQCLMRMREPSRGQRFSTNFFRVISIALIPISSVMPSCMCLYWTVSSLLGLCQNLILLSNRVKSAFRIPDTPSTLDHPYHQLAKEISQRLRLRKS